jgi:hypothetical protein
MDDYLDLVNDSLKQPQISLFDQVRILVTRAYDLHNGKMCRIKELNEKKPEAIAQYELFSEAIEPYIYKKEKKLSWLSEDQEEEIFYQGIKTDKTY